MSDTPPDAPRTATRDDLLDVEAPPQGGEHVDTPAYAIPPEPGSERATIPEDLIDVEAPPPAMPELGGGERAGSGAPDGDLLDRAADALLRLAGERPWAEITLRDVAAAAGARFAELYARAPGKRALLLRLSARLTVGRWSGSRATTSPPPATGCSRP